MLHRNGLYFAQRNNRRHGAKARLALWCFAFFGKAPAAVVKIRQAPPGNFKPCVIAAAHAQLVKYNRRRVRLKAFVSLKAKLLAAALCFKGKSQANRTPAFHFFKVPNKPAERIAEAVAQLHAYNVFAVFKQGGNII